MTRCAAAHPDDPSPCDGPTDSVTVRDMAQRPTNGCVRHGAVLLASLAGGVVHVGPGGKEGDAIAAYARAKTLKPFQFDQEES